MREVVQAAALMRLDEFHALLSMFLPFF